MTSTEILQTVVYGGHTLELTLETSGARTWAGLQIDGRSVRRPAGTDEEVLAKMATTIDRWNEDDEMLPDLLALIGRPASLPFVGISVGEIAAVHATGRMRTGRVIAVTRTRATVAYTTPSSGGRVYRKATALVPVSA